MTIRVHIERLVLSGLPVQAADGPLVRAAIESELTRLLGEQPIGPELERGAALRAVRSADVVIDSPPNPNALGRQLGEAVHGSLRR